MNRGPDPDPSHAEYVRAVEELHDESESGVPPGDIADALDVTERTARYRLDGLVEHGKIEDSWTRNDETNRWIRAFKPADDD